MKYKTLVFLFVLGIVSTIGAQTKTISKADVISIGVVEALQSKVLKEVRPLMIYAPEKRVQNLPLILVFDAASLFETTVAAVKFMNYSSEIPQMPEAIVVGILNTNRDRDMPTPQQFGVGNGEKKFKDFIKNELLPWLNKKYALNGQIVLVGHSQGGLFVSYLLSEEPSTFSWIISLDAPMDIDSKTNKLKELLLLAVKEGKVKVRYISIESTFGWDDEHWKAMPQNGQTMKLKLTGESHESMPFKGIYEGLNFLFKDFSPKRKDLSLSSLKDYYKSISEKYGYAYEIPLKTLTASASRKIIEGRKTEILELVDYAEAKYAPSGKTVTLKADAEKITQQPNLLIDSILTLPKPSVVEISPYLGRWMGQLIVPRGQNSPVDIEIKVEGGIVKLLSVIPWNPSQKEESEILHITKKGELVFGRVNRGGGLFVTTCSIDKNGQLTGEERLVGFNIPENESADFKEQMNFVLKNPNKISLSKK